MVDPAPRFLDTYVPYVLRQADQTLSAPFYEVLTRYGVARSEWRVLAVLEDLGDLGVVELARAALSPQPTVTHALRRLEERGLITRRPGELDRRQRVVSITETGSSLTRSLMAEATELETAALVDTDGVDELIARLRDLTASVEAAVAARAADTERGAG